MAKGEEVPVWVTEEIIVRLVRRPVCSLINRALEVEELDLGSYMERVNESLVAGRPFLPFLPFLLFLLFSFFSFFSCFSFSQIKAISTLFSGYHLTHVGRFPSTCQPTQKCLAEPPE